MITAIDKLFKIRSDVFAQHTQSILQIIPHVTHGIVEFLAEMDQGYEEGNITWDDISLIDDHVVMFGLITYDIGSSFVAANQLVTITADNQEFFRRIIRFGIPISIVRSGNQRDVVSFLVEMHTQEQEDSMLEQSIANQIAHDSHTDSHNDFDLDALTPEQRQSLELYMKTNGQ